MTAAMMQLKAYEIGPTDGWAIEPLSPRREWMDATPDKVAYRCLPLVMANQAGWVIKSPATFSCTWNGAIDTAALKVVMAKGDERFAERIVSHFGSGILTFHLPWLFRTPTGWGLWARGPTNFYKENLAPLDGIIETDWAPYSFTMNWKVTKRGTPVWFQKGDPICMLVPYPLDALERFEPSFAPLGSDKQTDEDYTRWAHGRAASLREQQQTGSKPFSGKYMRGRRPDGTEVEEHRSNFKLLEFKRS